MATPPDPNNPAPPEGTTVEDLGGGVSQVNVPANPPDPEADKAKAGAGDDEAPPEGFDSWKAYAESLKSANPKEDADKAADTSTPEAQIKAAVEALPEENRAAATAIIESATKTGDLTPEQKVEAAKLWNVPEAFVDTYLNGLKADAASLTAPIFEAAGGEAQYKEFSAWATSGGLTDAEIAAFDAGLDTDPAKTVSEAVAKWKASGGGSVKDVARGKGGAEETPAVVGFADEQEMVVAMSDPRYETSASYRAEVERKVAAMKG